MFRIRFKMPQKKDPLIKILPVVRGRYLQNISLARHTWFGVGGNAEIMYIPEDAGDLAHFLRNKPHNVPVCLIGGGSNLLVRDGGVPGVVIKLDNASFQKVTVGNGTITCGAGFRNIDLKKHLLKHELGGLEFLCSIPGVIGGSVKTNAGCFGREVADVMQSAEIMNGEGKIQTVTAADLGLSYRSSLFPDDWIILSITFKTEPSTREEIARLLEEHKQYRKARQPYNQKTAGSTFKNPEGLKAWELIKKAGCAELAVGGAKVSEKHCNFLINTGNATAKDIETLGETIIQRVRQETFITLEWEIKKTGNRKITMITAPTVSPSSPAVSAADKRVYLPRLWPYRLIGNVLLLILLGFASAGMVIAKNNLVTQKLNSLSDYFYTLTSYLGFTVDDILVYGRNKTAIEEINNIVNTRRGDNILRLDIRQMKSDLEQLPWVKSATVSRSYLPNLLKITLKERRVRSLWQINNAFYPIDTDGAVIRADFVPSRPVLLIVGRGAPEHLNELLTAVEDDNEVFPRIKVANFISGRRWNLILDDVENGITVKLPAEDMDKAWKKLLKLNKTQGLLKRKLTIIDLRFANKVLVKPRRTSDEERLASDAEDESNI